MVVDAGYFHSHFALLAQWPRKLTFLREIKSATLTASRYAQDVGSSNVLQSGNRAYEIGFYFSG